MNRIYYLILSLCWLLISCGDKEKQDIYQKNIKGDWINVVVNPNPGNIARQVKDITGFSFYGDNTIDNKGSYYNRRNFLGSISKYKIRHDSLFIFDLNNKYWMGYKIVDLTTDTLKLEQFGISASFAHIRKNSKLQSFDTIVLSTSGCYGTCPVFNISISANGDAIFQGEEYALRKGIYRGTLSKELYKLLENYFTRLNIDTLKTKYEARWTDDETVTVTFYKNGEIYKTISDYGHQAPYPFRWAYNQLRELYNTIKLEPLAIPDYLGTNGPINRAQYDINGTLFYVRKTEWFLLYQQLLNAKVTNHQFKPKFALDVYNYWDPGQGSLSIPTDGRYYKFAVKGTQITLDIGDNFFDTNKKALTILSEENPITR